MRSRDLALERELTVTAARAAGLSPAVAESLRGFADRRAHPGGVRPRTPEEWDREVAEELADAANYLVWRLIELYPGYVAGDPYAAELFERRLRRLRRVLQAWAE